MTINEIKEALDDNKQLYIDDKEIKVIFLEEITETIEVEFIESGIKTFITKSSISDIPVKKNVVRLDECFIINLDE